MFDIYISAVSRGRRKKGGTVPSKALDLAINQIHRYIRFRNHDDLDIINDVSAEHQLIRSIVLLFSYFVKEKAILSKGSIVVFDLRQSLLWLVFTFETYKVVNSMIKCFYCQATQELP